MATVNYGSMDYILHKASPLHYAVHKGWLKTAELLLEDATDVNSKTKDGITPLSLAVMTGNFKMCELLFRSIADPNLSDLSGISPLHWAVQRNDVKIVQLLLERDADVNQATSDDLTPIFIAVKNGYHKVVLTLLKYGADTRVSLKGISILHVAVAPDWYQIEELRTKNHSSARTKGQRNHTPTKTERFNILAQLLLRSSIDPSVSDPQGATPLHLAVYENDYKVAELLLQKKSNPNKKDMRGNSPIYLAAKFADCKLIELFLKFNGSPNSGDSDGTSLLHLTVARRMYDATKLILEHNASVNKKNRDGVTPFFIAAGLRNLQILELLLRHGADADIPDRYGNSPLYVALRGNKEEVKVKFEYSLSNMTNCIRYNIALGHYEGNSYPVRNDEQILEFLLRWGTNPNSMNRKGYTSAHVGILRKSPEIIDLLLTYDFNPCHPIAGLSTLYFAMVWKEMDIFKVLLENCSVDVAYKLFEMITGDWERYSSYYKLIVKYLVKLKVAEGEVSEVFLRLASFEDANLIQFREECEAEISFMKNNHSGSFSISEYEILTSTSEKLVKRLRKENLLADLEREDWEVKYPIYGGILNWRLKRVANKIPEIEEFETAICNIFSNLPSLIIQKIICYFTPFEVRKFVSISKPEQYRWSYFDLAYYKHLLSEFYDLGKKYLFSFFLYKLRR